jgi:hypothetical protein
MRNIFVNAQKGLNETSKCGMEKSAVTSISAIFAFKLVHHLLQKIASKLCTVCVNQGRQSF